MLNVSCSEQEQFQQVFRFTFQSTGKDWLASRALQELMLIHVGLVNLHSMKQRVVYTFMPMSLILFMSGAALAFLLVFDPVLEFLFSYASKLELELTPFSCPW